MGLEATTLPGAHVGGARLSILVAGLLVATSAATAIPLDEEAPPWGFDEKVHPPNPRGQVSLGQHLDAEGDTVAISGDYRMDFNFQEPWQGIPGAVHVFERSETAWEHEANLTVHEGPFPVNPWNGKLSTHGFGEAIALEEDTLAVGAPAMNTTEPAAGTVYIYERSEGAWTQTANLSSPSPDPWGFFGQAVALDEDTLVVGAPLEEADGHPNQTGLAHVFHRSEGGWSYQDTLVPHLHQDRIRFNVTWFGIDLDVHDGTAVVTPVEARPGTAVFDRAPNGSWHHAGELVDERGLDETVRIHGDTIFATERSGDVVRVFTRNATGWELTETIEFPKDDAGRWAGIPDRSVEFGDAIDLHDEAALIGAPQGLRAYLYHEHPDGWHLHQRFDRDDGQGRNHYGRSVALSEAFVAIGAPSDSSVILNGGTFYAYGSDADGDRLSTWGEENRFGTQAGDPDTDGDLFSDGTEVLGAEPFGPEMPRCYSASSDPTNPTSVPVCIGSVTVTEEPPVEEMPVTDGLDPVPLEPGVFPWQTGTGEDLVDVQDLIRP